MSEEIVKKLKVFSSNRDGERTFTPWSDETYTYASDSITLIRVPRVKSVPIRQDAPSINTINREYPVPSVGWVDIPNAAEIVLPECPKCKGKTTPTKRCPECKGEGIVPLHNRHSGYEVECKSCGGSGVVYSCNECCGTGYLDNEDNIQIKGHLFRVGRLFHIVKEFGPLKIADNQATNGLPVWFQFEGGHALVAQVKMAKDF